MYYRNQRSFYASRVKGQSGLTPPRIGVTRHTHTHTYESTVLLGEAEHTRTAFQLSPPFLLHHALRRFDEER